MAGAARESKAIAAVGPPRLYSSGKASHASGVRSSVASRCSLILGLACAALGCGSEPLATEPTPDGPGLVPPGATARLVPLFELPTGFNATALAFDPTRPGELWVTLRQPPSAFECTMADTRGCNALIGQIALVRDATGDAPSMTIARDGNAWHFMRRPTSIAFGDNGNLATCGEARSDNYTDDAVDYAGPVLWSSDPSIFGVKPQPGQNGTHLDMLHETPFCMGIAHERDNVYWTFNGKLGALDRYDFREPHVIGGEDHADGEILRYAEGQLARVPEIPSHLAFDAARGQLYVADTGNGRVVRLDIASGTPGANIAVNEALVVHRRVDGAMLSEVVPSTALFEPSGLTFVDDTLIVANARDGSLAFFDREGTSLGKFDTDLTSLSGVNVGPDGLLYVADQASGAYRIQTE
jgi:hypothetical protein